MATKKEWINPGVHPNPGTPVTLLLENKETEKTICKKGSWNRTHWVLKNGHIPENLRLVGWSI